MKVKFWKYSLELYFYLFLIIPIAFLFLIFAITDLSPINSFEEWLVIAVFSSFLIFCIAWVFIDKNLLSKVVFSEKGLEIIRFKKQVTFISWDDITEVKTKLRGRGNEHLMFVCGKTQVDIFLTKKMYNIIMLICPNECIKRLINNIDYFKSFHIKEK